MGDYSGFETEPSMDDISLVSGTGNENRENIELGDEISLISGAADLSSEYSELAEEWYLLGKSMYELGNYAKARPHLERALKCGKREAACYLGAMYYRGNGVEKSYAEAFRYYSMAEGVETTERLFGLAYMYQEGKGTEINNDKAYQYYKRVLELAQNGDINKPVALNNLGVLYANGRGCKKDIRKAMRYYNSAAELGNTAACYNLGYRYEYGGDGVAQNMYLAYSSYKRAADLGHQKSKKKLEESKWDEFKRD